MHEKYGILATVSRRKNLPKAFRPLEDNVEEVAQSIVRDLDDVRRDLRPAGPLPLPYCRAIEGEPPQPGLQIALHVR